MGLDQALGVSRVPFGRAGQTANLASLPIDEDGRRHADDAQGRPRAGRGVDVKIKIFNFYAGEELARGVDAGAVQGQGHDLELVRAQLLLQAVERGHFLPARSAPCGPEVEEDGFAFEIIQ